MAHLATTAKTAAMVNPARMARRAVQAKMLEKKRDSYRNHRNANAKPMEALLDHKVPRAATAPLAMLANLAAMVNQAVKDHQARLAQLALLDKTAPRDRLATLAKLQVVQKAHQVQLVTLARLVLPARLAILADPAKMAVPARLARLAMQAPQADLANLAVLEDQAMLAKLARPAAAITAHRLVWLQVIKRRRTTSRVACDERINRAALSTGSFRNTISTYCLSNFMPLALLNTSWSLCLYMVVVYRKK